MLTLCLSPHSLPITPGVSRGPSPVVLGFQDSLPVATAFTEYVHAYFRGHSHRYVVMRDSVDSDRQTGLSGGCASGLQQGQPLAVFCDLLYHGRASYTELSNQAPVLRAVRTTEGV